MLSQFDRVFTEQPPEVKRWSKGGETEAEQGGEAQVLGIGESVQALFQVDEEGTKTWYSGVVVRQDVETGLYLVRFDDGEEVEFQGDNHAPLSSLFDCAGCANHSDLCLCRQRC